jgi:hypothetical protein
LGPFLLVILESQLGQKVQENLFDQIHLWDPRDLMVQ